MNLKKLVLSAFFLALGLVLPFVTGQIPQIGKMLLPMHIPVLLCGMIAGGPYGMLVGFICPLLRSVLFGMPALMPNAVGMAFELATYGLVAGILYGIFGKKKFGSLIALIGAMLAGRIVWGIASLILYRILGNAFSAQIFVAGAFLNAIPGIIIQLILIPLVVESLKKAHVLSAVTA